MLRAIGPVTHRLMSMRQWREASLAAGFTRAETYVATGNMVVSAALSAADVQAKTEAILQSFALGANNGVFVRRPDDLKVLIAANPFADAAAERPDALAGFFFAGTPDFGWIAGHQGEERLHVAGDHLIVDYPMPISKAKLTPAKIERRCGTAMTARNWNTVRALLARSEAAVI